MGTRRPHAFAMVERPMYPSLDLHRTKGPKEVCKSSIQYVALNMTFSQVVESEIHWQVLDANVRI